MDKDAAISAFRWWAAPRSSANISHPTCRLDGPDEIASIKMEFAFVLWQEDADPPKWDPRNKETADHSLPYIVSRMIIDKEIYLDSFTKEKYMDPAVRELMNKVTIHPHNDPAFGNGTRITVRKKSGEERVFTGKPATPMSHDELVAKYNRICGSSRSAKTRRIALANSG